MRIGRAIAACFTDKRSVLVALFFWQPPRVFMRCALPVARFDEANAASCVAYERSTTAQLLQPEPVTRGTSRGLFSLLVNEPSFLLGRSI